MNTRLKDFLYRHEISQKRIADLSDLSQDQVNRIVNGRRPATISEAAAILAAVKAVHYADESIRLDDLFEIEREPVVESPIREQGD